MADQIDKPDTDTTNWLDQKFPGAIPKKVTEHPWAKTWVFQQDDQRYFLKQIYGNGSAKVLAAQSISSSFQDVVPSVVACSPELAAMVVADHGGEQIKSRSDNMQDVLTTYAGIQAQAVTSPSSPASTLMRDVEPVNLYQDLMDFLDPDIGARLDGGVGAEFFTGRDKAVELHQLFSQLGRILLPHLAKASVLPRTLNHCDLRPPNMARRKDGSISIFDWDDAVWGPVGLSLHAQFSGCLRPHLALHTASNEPDDKQIRRDRSNLDTYINAFADHAGIDRELVRENLSAAVVAGALVYVIGFGDYPVNSTRGRGAIASNIFKRLDSVLDVVEHLSSSSPSQTALMADVCQKNGQQARFDRLQKRIHQRVQHQPSLNANAAEEARKPGVFPAISFTDVERDTGICTPANAELAAQIYKEQGAVLLKNSLKREVVEECRDYIIGHYDDYFRDNRPKDSLRVGNKRFMITLALEGALNRPVFYAPPTIMPILTRLLSDKLILGSMVAVTSLPGAKDQSRHRDHKALFLEEEVQHPPFATSVMIPLIDMDEEVGATRIFKGTHLVPTDEANKMPHQDPVVSVGSCFLMDYRVQHMGMANKSDKVRPVATLLFQRPWFRDYVNYDNQERMIIPDVEFDKIPEQHSQLFNWK